MAVYPRADGDRVVSADDLERIVAAIFRTCNMRDADAALLAHTLVLSDLRGIHSHGVLRVPDYVRKLTVEGVDPRGTPRIVSDRGSAIVVDGGNSMGQIGGSFAMRLAVARARETGVAFAAVRGSNHCGAMDHYAMLAAAEGMIGLAGTNALPTMAPWGGTEKIVGINPLAIAVPAATQPPLVLDIAFGATAHGKIRVYHQKNARLPEGWAFDREGRPTTDATEALLGLIQPIGGHKGIGLGMMVGVLSSLLSGATYGTELGNMTDGPRAGLDGHFFAAISIAHFTDPAAFGTRVDRIIQEVHGSARAPGVLRLLVPGELEADSEQRYRSSGIPLSAETLSGVITAAETNGVDARPLAA